jgi:hypothetical protein
VDDQRGDPVGQDRGGSVAYNRSWEWRDALGCLWLPGLFVILSVAIGLGALGVPRLALQVGTAAAMIAMLIAFWRISRSGTKV